MNTSALILATASLALGLWDPAAAPALLGQMSSQVLLIVLSMVIGASTALLVMLGLQKANVVDVTRQAKLVVAKAHREAALAREQGQADAKLARANMMLAFEEQTEQARRELRDRQMAAEQAEEAASRTRRRLEQQQADLAEQEANTQRQRAAAAQAQAQAQQDREELAQRLLAVSSMTAEQAREALFARLEGELAKECSALIQRRHQAAIDEADERAREVIVTAVQRCAAPACVSSTVTTIDLPSDEMKGRVIGREGRNIRAFEKATGAEVIVDDTPGVIALSCFDPVRREVAGRSMRRLLEDGRIHPARIEELVAECTAEVEREIKRFGEDACLDADVGPVPPKLIELLGKLQFRTSYGQNVLAHSVEVAMLSGLMAGELKLDQKLARRAGLMHDIGKAIDREMEGGHTAIGADQLTKAGESEPVVNAAAGHHGDVPATSLYTPLITAADAISAARPGARRESLERYLRRMEHLESIGTSFPGVEQCYAVMAGREVRVIVDASRVPDDEAHQIARQIAERIQDELTYPGEIKVTLIRELRAVEYAR